MERQRFTRKSNMASGLSGTAAAFASFRSAPIKLSMSSFGNRSLIQPDDSMALM
jgi:hypothetical protein